MYFQGDADPRALTGQMGAPQMGGEAMYAGTTTATEEMNGGGQLGTPASDAYLALANAKLAIKTAQVAATSGNCGGAQEKLALAWQHLFAYSQLAAKAGMSSKLALSLHAQLAKVETLGAMNCNGLQGAPMPVEILGASSGSKLPWILGGVVAVGVVGAVVWAVMRKKDEE